MRDSIYKITLDIHNTDTQVQVTAKRGDSARRIYMTLTEHGTPWKAVLDGNTRAVLSTKLQSSSVPVYNDCDIRSDGTIIFDFTAQTAADAGLVDCCLHVYDADADEIASPAFVIAVVEHAHDGGQTSGSEWRQAIADMQERVAKTAVTYATADEMLAAPLGKGQMVSTRGRWADNDGGARTYLITDRDGATLADGLTINPLALPLPNGTLYAVPIIEDQVTVLDIGLERGRIRMSDLPIGQNVKTYADTHERDDGWPAATNSEKLQAYLSAVHQYLEDTEGTNVGSLGVNFGGAALNRIFFPAGHWYFRDPIVVEKPFSFVGTRKGNALEEGRVFPRTTGSAIVFLAQEYVARSGRQETTDLPYYGYDCRVSANATTPGDENFDRTADPYVRESAYIDHALFYVAASNVNFTGLDFRAESRGVPAFEWHYHPNNDRWIEEDVTNGAGRGPQAAGWKPNGGKPWNPYIVHRHYKGVCAIIVRNPIRNASGQIYVKPSYDQGQLSTATVRYEATDSWGIPKYTSIDTCGFSGFSGPAVIGGRLSLLTNSTFIHNYVAYVAAQDDSFYSSYFGNGFVGLVTQGYQPLSTSGMYIDMMAGFGVMGYLSHLTFQKRTVKYVKQYDAEAGIYPTGVYGDGGESAAQTYKNGRPIIFCEHEKPVAGGRLYGHFDIVIDTCVMGGYFGYTTDWGAKISGILERCGSLYNCDIPIVSKNEFQTQEKYYKAKDFHDHMATVYATYGTETPMRWTGDAWAASDDTSQQTITAYLDGDCGTSANVPKLYAYVHAYADDAEPQTNAIWDSTTSTWQVPTGSETGQTLSAFLTSVRPYSKQLLYVDWLKAGDDGIQLEPNEVSYYDSLAAYGALDNDDVELIESIVDEYASQYAIDAATEELAKYNEEYGTSYTLEEAVELHIVSTEPTQKNINDAWKYVEENWNEIMPSSLLPVWKVRILRDRRDNFDKLVGTAAVSVMLAKGLVFSGQVISCPLTRDRRSTADAWSKKDNMATLYGFNLFYSVDTQLSGFSRVPLNRTTGTNKTGTVMKPVILQVQSPTLLCSAVTHASEDATFALITNNTAASASDRKRLILTLRHTADGKFCGYVYGSVTVEDGVAYGPSGDLLTGATAYSNLAFLKFVPYQNHYGGVRPNVLAFPLFRLSAGAEVGGAQVATMIINFNRMSVSLYGLSDYTGEIFPFFL